MSNGYQMQMFDEPPNINDVVYTPDWVAQDMVEYFHPAGKILEPCIGNGVFLKYLPKTIYWCEIKKGKDFYLFDIHVDWIIGNPPYSDFSQWMEHSYKLSDNICYLIPINKPFNSGKIFRRWKEYGGIKEIRYYAEGGVLGFPIGFACGAVYYKKGYRGGIETSIYEKKGGEKDGNSTQKQSEIEQE